MSDASPASEPLDVGNLDIDAMFLGDLSADITSGVPPGDLDGSFGEPEGGFSEPPPLDSEESGLFGDVSQPVGDGACLVCGAPTFRPPGLTQSGRKKRVPKYCDLHTSNVRVSQERPNLTGVESQLRRIQEELADDIRLLGTLAGPLFPVTGYFVFEHADPFTIALLKLAKNNQRVLRVLHRAAQVAPIYTVAECVAGTAYAVQVDTKKADPYNNISRRLGVTRAYEAIYTVEQQNNVSTNGFVAPPRYAT